jgi:hypothetical protein
VESSIGTGWVVIFFIVWGVHTHDSGLARAENNGAPLTSDEKQVGLGVEWKPGKGALEVVKVIRGGPAERAGLVKGDRILAVDGHPTAEVTAKQIAELFEGKKNGSPLLLAVVSEGMQVRAVQITPGVFEPPPAVSGDHAVVLAAARAHLLTRQQRDAERAFFWRIRNNVEQLKEPIAIQVQFMAKVGQLTAEEIESLQRDGSQAIERYLRPTNKGAAGRLVVRRVVVVNGQADVREELSESPQILARRELAPVLKAISFTAWEKFDAERERLERRRKRADVLAQIAAFDEALLLTREQRDKLSDLLNARWTDVWRGHVTGREATDPISLCRTAAGAMGLFTIPDVELQAILRPSQVATFKLVQLPTKEVSIFIQGGQNHAARRFVRRGLPIEEERQWLTLLLQRRVDDAESHAGLGEEKRQKLLTAGKLDLEAYFQRQAVLESKSEDDHLVVMPLQQIAGVNIRLPPIFDEADSTFQRIYRKRLSLQQREQISEAGRQRGRFHRQAVIAMLTVALCERAALTDGQAERVQGWFADTLANSVEADDLVGYRQATFRQLAKLRPEAIEPRLDDWQRPAAREYLNEFVDAALIARPDAP